MCTGSVSAWATAGPETGTATRAVATIAPRTRARPWRTITSSAQHAAFTTPNRGTSLQPERLRDDVLLDLRRSSVDRRDHRAAQIALHRVLGRVSVAAHDLDALERAPLRKLGRGELHHRRLLRQHASRILVGQARDPAHEEPALREVGSHVRELVRDRLERADRTPELLALLGVGEGVVERALRQSER